MPHITNYIQRPATFGPEAISAMGDAYERALKTFNHHPRMSGR